MKRIIDGLFYWNATTWAWERTDRIQEYNGVKIVSITYRFDGKKEQHKEYEIQWPDGRICCLNMNKRTTIDDVKFLIDHQ